MSKESPNSDYPLTYSVDYPKRQLNRTSTLLRIFYAIPILILLGTVSAMATRNYGGHSETIAASGGLLFCGPLLMIVFRQKYPRWWFDWNLEFLRFSSRVMVYLALMDDRYPSTDEKQSVHLSIAYPNVKKDLSRWLPLFKWFFAFPHYFVLFFVNIAALLVVIAVWFNIVITGEYPEDMFNFVVGVMRWNLRVLSYAFLLVTDVYPPFSTKE